MYIHDYVAQNVKIGRQISVAYPSLLETVLVHIREGLLKNQTSKKCHFKGEGLSSKQSRRPEEVSGKKLLFKGIKSMFMFGGLNFK